MHRLSQPSRLSFGEWRCGPAPRGRHPKPLQGQSTVLWGFRVVFGVAAAEGLPVSLPARREAVCLCVFVTVCLHICRVQAVRPPHGPPERTPRPAWLTSSKTVPELLGPCISVYVLERTWQFS